MWQSSVLAQEANEVTEVSFSKLHRQAEPEYLYERQVAKHHAL